MTHDLGKEEQPEEASACHWSGSASAYLMGTLLGDRLQAYLEHLERGCEECDDELGEDRSALALLDATTFWNESNLVPPPAGLLGGIQKRLHDSGPAKDFVVQTWRDWRSSSAPQRSPGLFTLPADQGAWEPIAIPGIFVKRLAVDEERRLVTMLIRMDPGTSYPPHRHAAAEECYVIAGELHVGDQVLRAGDYQRAEAGSLHGVQWTERGCTLFLVSSQDDQLVA